MQDTIEINKNGEVINKKPKRWRCTICGKEYCYMKSAMRHRNTKGCEKHTKFKDILDLKAVKW